MGPTMQTRLVQDALTTEVWRRRPKDLVIIHSELGSQFGRDEFNCCGKDNRLSPNVSWRGNCWDNAVAESFISNLMIDRIKKQIYPRRAEAKSDIFDYIGGFYNQIRRYKHLEKLSPCVLQHQRQTAL